MNNESANASSNHWQPFIYLGESPHGDSGYENNSLEQGETTLAKVQVGDRVRILSLNCGESNSRLMGMGLVPGVVLEVISYASPGSVIVSLQDQRLGLGIEIAKRIQVVNVDQSRDHSQLNPIATQRSRERISHTPPVKLRNAAIGSVLRVIGYEPTMRSYKRKLLAMGLTPGTELCVMRHAPLGDPTEIRLRDFHLSLRKDEADALLVTPVLEGE